MKNVIALTSHPVNILRKDVIVETLQVKGRPTLIYKGECLEKDIVLKIPSSGLPVPQVSDVEPTSISLNINGVEVPVSKIVGKEIKNLPDFSEDCIFITSSFTQAAAKELGRVDIYAPTDLICTLNDDGSTTIVGTRGLKY